MAFDATRLLGALTESLNTTPTAQQRMQAALQGGASAPANPLQSALAALGGGAGGGLSGMLGQAGVLAERAFGGTAREVQANNPVAVGGLGALAGALMGGGRGAVGGGLLAALGSLAVAALQNSGRQAVAPVPASEEELNANALLVLRAMIEAAKADGHVDAAEMRRILGQLDAAGADGEARQWVLEQLAAPSDIPGLAAQVTSPEIAAEVYAAALMAIEVNSEAERSFLARLAEALRLPPAATARIHQALGVAV